MEFHWPVGTEQERVEFGKLPGAWIAATKYAQRYDATGKWSIHTGLDLNLNFDRISQRPHFDLDAHAPVYAAASGEIVFAGALPVWGNVIVMRHVDETLPALCTRYAHVEQLRVKANDMITRGTQIAQVGNAMGRYPYHLHYDVARIDLKDRPGDWPGDRLSVVLRDYLDPLALMRGQMLPAADGGISTRLRVTASPSLRVRQAPSSTATIIDRIGYGEIVEPVEIRDGWARIEKPIAGWIVLSWTQPAPRREVS